MRRIVLGLICLLVATSCLHSNQHKTDNQSSKEKPVIELKILLMAEIMPKPTIPLGVTPEDMVKWGRVATCEMGGNWNYVGSIYSGSLGIRNTNWVAYGGLQYAPNAGLATPEQQVDIAKKINKGHSVPDQYGCGHGW